MEQIFFSWGLEISDYEISTINSGLINKTLYCKARKERNGKLQRSWVLQRLNTSVFKCPDAIASNLVVAQAFIEGEKKVVTLMYPVRNKIGQIFTVCNGDEYWRLLPFLEDSMTLDVVDNEEQAYEAARQYGILIYSLHGAPIEKFQYTIPDFHDLSLYYQRFVDARKSGREGGEDILIELEGYRNTIVDTKLISHLKKRIVHHDTKLSNVLFSSDGRRGLAPIDLDTLMPGLVISDVGDMVRSFVCSVTEHEPNLEKVRAGMHSADKIFRAIIKGFLSGAKSVMSQAELEALTYSGPFMIYMQALRFATDWLDGDVYYPTAYSNQNLDRALNQLCLLKCVLEPSRRALWRVIVKEEVSPLTVDPW